MQWNGIAFKQIYPSNKHTNKQNTTIPMRNTIQWFARIIILLLPIVPVTTSLEEDRQQIWPQSHPFQPLTFNIFTNGNSETRMVDHNNNSAQSSILFGGRYTTTVDVRNMLDLGNDVAAMMDATLQQGSNTVASRQAIYRQGTTPTTTTTRIQNTTVDSRTTLASLSLDATNLMLDDPIFTLYRHAFVTKSRQSGSSSYFKGGQDSQFYADAILSDLFERNVTGGVQPEAALILSVWMAAVHELNNVLVGCTSMYNRTASMIALDQAAALWAGTEQQQSSSSTTTPSSIPSLYLLAQSTGAKFGQSSSIIEGEAWVNTQIVEGFAFLQSQLLNSSSDQQLVCSKKIIEDGNNQFRDTINRLIELMVVPLIQNLIHYGLSGANDELAQVYLFAVLPHILACDPNVVRAIDVESFDFDLTTTADTQKVLWVKSIQKGLSCVRLKCQDIGSYSLDPDYPPCQDDSYAAWQLAGYGVSLRDAMSYSRMDRDLIRLEILLQFGADQAALDLYRHGYSAPFSLQELAVNAVIPGTVDGSLFDRYKLYYNTNSYSFVDLEVRRAISRFNKFENATTEEIVDVVVGLLAREASYLSVVSALEKAKDMCNATVGDELNRTALGYWDISAAFYIGSIEGTNEGGRNGGRLLYAASKRLCPLFGTCFDGNSKINTALIEAFSLGNTYLSQRACTSLINLIEDAMLPALQEILLQGTVAYGAASAFGNSTSIDARLGIGHAYARAVLPQVYEANNESGSVIKKTLLLPNARNLGVSEFYEAMTALQVALPNMAADCQSVGSLKEPAFSLCKSMEKQLPQNDIAFERYIFSDIVRANQIAAVALDVRDMKMNISVPEALKIYEDGRNAFLASNLNQNKPVSLASFSREASTFMSQDPLFNLYKFALYEDEVFDTDDAFNYADDYVQEIFANLQDAELAAEAAVVLNTWMMIAHHLYSAVRACDEKGDAVINIDSAVALWIGRQQIEGSFSDGWLFYSIAQAAAQGFGQEEKEATVNTQLMDAFNSLQNTGKSCKTDLGAHLKLRWEVQSIVRILSVPLVQHLFLAIAANEKDKAALYARSVIPQSVRCDPYAHSELSKSLTAGFSGGIVSQNLIENLGVFLKCMEMSCQDFNYTETAPEALKELVTNTCSVMSKQDLVPMFSDPSFLPASRIDLDILQIEIFMRTKAYDVAYDWYQNGQNAALESDGKSMTLQQLATLQSEKAGKHLRIFDDYHGSQGYADEHVTDGMGQRGLYTNASRSQRAVGVSTALQATISYRGIIWNLEQAVSSCRDKNKSSARQSWATAVAIFTGSTGNRSTLRHGGFYAFSAFGEEFCHEFGRCTEDGNSRSNQALYDALSKGYALVDKMMCTEGEELFQSTIIPLLQVPLIQGSLKSSIFHSDKESKAKMQEEFPSGYVMVQTMLPYVANISAESADTIASVFGSPLDRISSSKETESIFEAFQNSVPQMGIDCNWIGVSVVEPSLSICHSVSSGLSPAAVWGITVTSMALGVIIILLLWKMKCCNRGIKGSKSLDEDSCSSADVSTSAENECDSPPKTAMERRGFDQDAIDNSYLPSSGTPLSRKAKHMLSRIVRYGDDDDNNICLYESSSSDRQSSLPDVVPKGQSAIVKRVMFLVDDDGSILESGI